MIKTEYGHTNLRGNNAMVITDFISATEAVKDMLVRDCYMTEAQAKRKILESVDIALEGCTILKKDKVEKPETVGIIEKKVEERKMINTKVGKITLEGSKAELISDLAVIVRGIKETIMEDDKETEESVKQDIDEAVKVGLMNEEEFNKKIKEPVATLIKDLFGGLFDEDK